MRILLVFLVLVLVILTAPFWHAAFEQKQLKIYSCEPKVVAPGAILECHGENFGSQSMFWATKNGRQVKMKIVAMPDSHTVFVQVP